MINRIDLALVNQRRAARFGPCSNTGAIDSKSGRHRSSAPPVQDCGLLSVCLQQGFGAATNSCCRRAPTALVRGIV